MEEAKRQRNGCLTCRKRKKKCDGGYPICHQCNRLNFSCLREDLRYPSRKVGRPRGKVSHGRKLSEGSNLETAHHENLLAAPMIPQAPNILPFWIDNSSLDNDVARRRLSMRYYIERFTLLLTTTLENNCFLSIFLPMSMDSSLLRDAITAWSSTHLALQNNNYENTAREHRGIALSSLSKSLASQQRDPQMELASSLIHCAMESVTGDTNQWFKHLVGASEIIRSAAAVDHETHQTDLSKFTSTVEGRWLLSNFAYHDVMMTISEDRKPLLLAGDYWNFSVSQSGVADSYFGFASKVMSLISQISVLNVDMLNDDTTDTGKQGEQDDFATTAKSLQQELIDWKCPQSNNTMLVNLAESYRSAGLIHLYRILRRHRPKLTNATTLKIAEQVTVIVHRVQDIAIGSLAESSLLLPLFLAGGDAKDVQHIQIIRSRMQEIIKTRHFRNFQPALEVLEETWHMGGLGIRTGDGKPVDWKDVTKRKGWMLSIT